MNIAIHWPQATVLVLMALSAMGKMRKHGQMEEVNAGWAFVDAPLFLWLLYEGGFFGS